MEVPSASSGLGIGLVILLLVQLSLLFLCWLYGLYVQLLLPQPVFPHGVPQPGYLLLGFLLLKTSLCKIVTFLSPYILLLYPIVWYLVHCHAELLLCLNADILGIILVF